MVRFFTFLLQLAMPLFIAYHIISFYAGHHLLFVFFGCHPRPPSSLYFARIYSGFSTCTAKFYVLYQPHNNVWLLVHITTMPLILGSIDSSTFYRPLSLLSHIFSVQSKTTFIFYEHVPYLGTIRNQSQLFQTSPIYLQMFLDLIAVGFTSLRMLLKFNSIHEIGMWLFLLKVI